MTLTDVQKWRHRLPEVLSGGKNDLSSGYDSAAPYERHRFSRINALEQTPDMRKAELKEILERADSDRQRELELEELFALLDADVSERSENTTDGRDTNLEGLEELLVHNKMLPIEESVVNSRDISHGYLGTAGSDEGNQKGITEFGLMDVGIVEDTYEGILDTSGHLGSE